MEAHESCIMTHGSCVLGSILKAQSKFQTIHKHNRLVFHSKRSELLCFLILQCDLFYRCEADFHQVLVIPSPDSELVLTKNSW